MTADEAIKIKEAQYIDQLRKPKGKLAEADLLSIEALKRVRDNPIVVKHFFRALLPGETKD